MALSELVRGVCGAVFTVLLVLLASAPAVGSAQGVREVDWRNETFEVPAVGPCAQQSVTFADGQASTRDAVYRFTPDREIVFADVTGEGVEDALMLVECGPPNSEYSRALVAMTADPDVRPLGTVVSPPVWTQVPDAFTIAPDHLIEVTILDYETDRTHPEQYRWASSARAFVRVDG
ncbi:hypothetical protein GIY23_17480 [Allosaccharopolyspora coralli]|uniref:Uncharacterized protein n=1 Tax=Allosaccharopolyspora coralli TaxID=2665642 RepID=A0A5Q3QD17_9PSEU|nr:hypothetical protein [Allosaccharopolyspora coralli]QGK71074.1 hypothetical protein GIY23_17480 [Allosaccharopolyspora coralli]